MRRSFLWAGLMLTAAAAFAAGDPMGAPTPFTAPLSLSTGTAGVQVSTTPLGSPFYRHLAQDFDIPMREMIKFERKGFGRSEMVEIILIAKTGNKTIKELGNRRIKDHVPMETLAKEAGMNYREMSKAARDIKLDIEARGEKDLPPPVYEISTSTPTGKSEKKKANQSIEGEKKT
jgi:hypothetical protein